jgi:uncharacterized protein YcgI (DUF1989 family)
MAIQEIPGGAGLAVPLEKGQAVRLVNTFGSQVVDTWALARADTSEYLSAEHTRRMLYNLFPKQGDILYSNRRSPMLLLEEDTSPGRHDMLFACCDKWLYKHYGCPPGHANCRDNFLAALFAAGYDATLVPNPLNLWMNIPVSDSERVAIKPPLSRPGDHVVLRALMGLVLVFSACPMDIVPINGEDRTPKPVHLEILPAANAAASASSGLSDHR